MRVFLIVLDSLGVGALPDADAFGDEGTHTLDHLLEAAGGAELVRLQELGLGNATRISRVEVRWPGGGATEVFEDVPLDRFVEIREGVPGIRELTRDPFQLAN